VSLLAWNLAVQLKDCPEKMRDFFVLSFKVCTLANTVISLVLLEVTSMYQYLLGEALVCSENGALLSEKNDLVI